MESLLHALSAVKTCVQAHGTDYQKEAFDSIFKALEVLNIQPTNEAMWKRIFDNIESAIGANMSSELLEQWQTLKTAVVAEI